MNSKLLVIKQGKNVLIYNVVYDFYSLNEYFKYIDSLYGYTEKAKITTTIVNDVPISMNEYDMMKDICRVKDGYKVVEELEIIDDSQRLATIEIEIEYYSKISEMLKDAFLSSEPLLNVTSLVKLMNDIYGLPNNFEYNPIIDLKEKGKTWDDPRNWKLDSVSCQKYNKRVNQLLNLNPIKFNKKENENLFGVISNIIDTLKSYLSIEQIGIFPISDNMPEFLELLSAFAVRNQEAEIFFGSLENVNINFAGSEIINTRKEEICKTYNLKSNIDGDKKIKNRIDVFNKFLHF